MRERVCYERERRCRGCCRVMRRCGMRGCVIRGYFMRGCVMRERVDSAFLLIGIVGRVCSLCVLVECVYKMC